MSEKHLKIGDALPQFTGKLRVFAMRFCPYAERTVLVLNAKKLQYDLLFVNLDHKPEWLFNYSPKGTVPALEYEEGKAIFDSNIINAYLDEKYPEVPLQATDPLRRAQDKILVEMFASAQTAFYTAAYNPQAVKPNMVETYHKGLADLQTELKTRGTKYLHGDDPGLVDYTLFPFLERFEALPLVGQADFAMDKTKYELLVSEHHFEFARCIHAPAYYQYHNKTAFQFSIKKKKKGCLKVQLLQLTSACGPWLS